VCCQVEVSATDWSFVQRSPTDCGVSLCVIKKPRTRGGLSPLEGCKIQPPMGVVAPRKKERKKERKKQSRKKLILTMTSDNRTCLTPEKTIFVCIAQQFLIGQCLLIIEALRSHSDSPRSAGLLRTSGQWDTRAFTWQHTTLKRDRHPWSWRDSNPHSQKASGCRLTP